MSLMGHGSNDLVDNHFFKVICYQKSYFVDVVVLFVLLSLLLFVCLFVCFFAFV